MLDEVLAVAAVATHALRRVGCSASTTLSGRVPPSSPACLNQPREQETDHADHDAPLASHDLMASGWSLRSLVLAQVVNPEIESGLTALTPPGGWRD